MSDIILKTGDDVLFSGNASASKAIKMMSWLGGKRQPESMLTHHGTVFAPDIKNPKLFESTSISVTGINGVQINPLWAMIKLYDGKVWAKVYSFDRTIGFEASASNFIERHLGTPYESGICGTLELLLCGLRLDKLVRKFKPDYNPASTSNLHCTELGVLLKQHLNMMDDKAIANRMPPCEWWVDGEVDSHMLYEAARYVRLK